MGTILVISLIVLGAIFFYNYNEKAKAKQETERAERETQQEVDRLSAKKLNIVFMLTGWKYLEGKASEVQRNVQEGDLLVLEWKFQ